MTFLAPVTSCPARHQPRHHHPPWFPQSTEYLLGGLRCASPALSLLLLLWAGRHGQEPRSVVVLVVEFYIGHHGHLVRGPGNSVTLAPLITVTRGAPHIKTVPIIICQLSSCPHFALRTKSCMFLCHHKHFFNNITPMNVCWLAVPVLVPGSR